MIFSSPRSFQLVSYSAPHGLLLFRSAKTLTSRTRLDLLFQDVRAMEVRSWFEGIVIEERDSSFLVQFASAPTDMLEPGLRAYRLSSRSWSGYVLGGIVRSHEDDGDALAPSALIEC